jgi:hypothetical protein
MCYTKESQYLACLYWAFTTISTTGYGDIVPTTSSERFFVSMCVIFGALIFGYVVGSMASLVVKMDIAAAHYQVHAAHDALAPLYCTHSSLLHSVLSTALYTPYCTPYCTHSSLLHSVLPTALYTPYCTLHRLQEKVLHVKQYMKEQRLTKETQQKVLLIDCTY